MTFDARKPITRRGSIAAASPVLGFRPIRGPLARTVKLPKHDILPFATLQSLDDSVANRLHEVAALLASQSHFLEDRLRSDRRA